jgi:hypothetical protein
MTSDQSGTVELADRVAVICYAIAGWLTVGFGVALGVAAVGNFVYADASLGSGLLAALFLMLAFVLVSLGIFVNPGMRRRLNRRHGLSRFGRVQSVDYRVIRADERCLERCVECQCRVEEGLVRRYREEFALAGLPVYTSAEGHNHYCLDCASAELLGANAPDARTDPNKTLAASDRPLERTEKN